jgi:hypothetical protein
LEVGPALFIRRTSVHPDGDVIVAVDGVTAIDATTTSFAALPEGLVMVSVVPVVVAEAAARKAGVIPEAVAELAARKAIWAWAEA